MIWLALSAYTVCIVKKICIMTRAACYCICRSARKAQKETPEKAFSRWTFFNERCLFQEHEMAGGDKGWQETNTLGDCGITRRSCSFVWQVKFWCLHKVPTDRWIYSGISVHKITWKIAAFNILTLSKYSIYYSIYTGMHYSLASQKKVKKQPMS